MKSRVNVLGVMVNAIDMSDAVNTINRWIQNQESNYICVTSAHGILECHKDPRLKSILNSSGLTTPDGMSIVWILQIQGNRHVKRVYGPDLMKTICEESLISGWTHFLFGGGPGVAELLSDKLQQLFPGLKVVGMCTPPFREITMEEDQNIIREIIDAKPNIVWVGLSTPKQERWMASHINKIPGTVMIGVGAAFDFISGTKKQAPRWIQRSGTEWLFRLITEPHRLWRRYLQYPRFVVLVIMQLLGIKRYDSG